MKALMLTLLTGMITANAITQIPKLNSYPSASATIFLDFDGHYVQGTAWNWSGPIKALPAGLNASAITEIFQRVAEDFRIFNVNITTDSTVYFLAPLIQRTRIIVTPTYQWYGKTGGAAYVGSFTWGDETPAWVFSSALGYNRRSVAEAISHEAGHTLGLQHQSTFDATCNKVAEYAEGQGTGEIGWAPIMGVNYYHNLTTWHTGPNTISCNEIQHDVDIIAGNIHPLGLRMDEHADERTTASPILFDESNFSVTGLINSATDKDVFTFSIQHAAHLRINALPKSFGAGNAGANLDVMIALLNRYSDTIGRYNPLTLLNAGVDTNLNSGTYYLVVDGVGNANLLADESLGSYAISGTLDKVLPIHQLTLSGQQQNGVHHLNWLYQTDEPVKEAVIQFSTDGTHFTDLRTLPFDIQKYSWKPQNAQLLYYRVKLVTVADERAYYSNIITLREAHNNNFTLQSSMVTNTIITYAAQEYSYQLFDNTGRLLQRGQLKQGTNRIDILNAPKGLLVLHAANEQETITEKLIKH